MTKGALGFDLQPPLYSFGEELRVAFTEGRPLGELGPVAKLLLLDYACFVRENLTLEQLAQCFTIDSLSNWTRSDASIEDRIDSRLHGWGCIGPQGSRQLT